MLVRVTEPYVDTRASDLSLSFGEAPRSPLEAVRLTRGGFEVELRLLGCSHQVLARTGDDVLSEVVACGAGVAGDLPARHDRRLGGGHYRFGAAVEPAGPESLARLAELMTASAAAADDVLVGLFPGLPGAFTALALRELEGGVGWETWHAYPESGELVRTRSEVLR